MVPEHHTHAEKLYDDIVWYRLIAVFASQGQQLHGGLSPSASESDVAEGANAPCNANLADIYFRRLPKTSTIRLEPLHSVFETEQRLLAAWGGLPEKHQQRKTL